MEDRTPKTPAAPTVPECRECEKLKDGARALGFSSAGVRCINCVPPDEMRQAVHAFLGWSK